MLDIDGKDYLTIQEASKRSGVNQRTVHGWIAHEYIEPVRILNRVLLEREAFDRFASTRRNWKKVNGNGEQAHA